MCSQKKTSSILELESFVKETDEELGKLGKQEASTTSHHIESYGVCTVRQVSSSNGLTTEVFQQKNNTFLPPHCHPETSVRLRLESGSLIVNIEQHYITLSKGDVALIPAGFNHSVYALEDSVCVSMHYGDKLDTNILDALPSWPEKKGKSVTHEEYANALITAFLALKTDSKSWFFLVHRDLTLKGGTSATGISVESYGGWKLDKSDKNTLKKHRDEASEQKFLLSSFVNQMSDTINKIPDVFLAINSTEKPDGSTEKSDGYKFCAYKKGNAWQVESPDEMKLFVKEKEKKITTYLDFVFEHLENSKVYFFCIPPSKPSQHLGASVNLAVGSEFSGDPKFYSALHAFYVKVLCILQQHEFSCAEKALLESSKKSAKAAIMARNFSHNVGSHALANPNLYRKLGLRDHDSKQPLKTFHAYMQGRLDFLARAISDQSDRPEPLFFLNDVMHGFFKQGVLLDTLVDDAGFPAKKIKFCVTVNGTTYKYTWDSSTHCFSCTKTSVDDPVVGIPGGMVGTHALYAFLENILRNAVKYGAGVNNSTTPLEIHLQLHQCAGANTEMQPAWILSVWDNVSQGENCDVIRKYINTPLIQEKKAGALQSAGHGIQEMKLCAEALSGDDLRFPADADYAEKKCTPCTEGCDPTQHYHGYIQNLKNGQTKIETGQSLRCYVKDKRLVYDLLLPNPVLLGIVPLGNNGTPTDTPPPYVKYYRSIEELAKKGAQIGILLDKNCDKTDAELEKIAKLHTCLPFRLMVLTGNTENGNGANSWEAALAKKTPQNGADFIWGKHIPRNRLRIHADQTLWELLKSGQPNESKKFTFMNYTAWEAVMLRAYDSWLRAYKGGDLKWHLCIGFDHGGEANINRWNAGVTAINKEQSSCIAISVVSKDGDSNNTYETVSKVTDKDKDKDLLMFDNHKKAFDVSPEKTLFYQGMGAKEGLTLFQSLASPPQSGLGFGLFVYALVEGALTKVYTLDERVAKAVSDDTGTVDDTNTKSYNKAGIMPLFAFQANNKNSKLCYISKTTEKVNSDVLILGESCADDADVLLIHEGVMDLLSKKELWDRNDDTCKLFASAPCVVRVSGRGRETRHLDDAISFLEFNELSGNTYQEMNKPGLVKALLGASGSFDAACKSSLIVKEDNQQ